MLRERRGFESRSQQEKTGSAILRSMARMTLHLDKVRVDVSTTRNRTFNTLLYGMWQIHIHFCGSGAGVTRGV